MIVVIDHSPRTQNKVQVLILCFFLKRQNVRSCDFELRQKCVALYYKGLDFPEGHGFEYSYDCEKFEMC